MIQFGTQVIISNAFTRHYLKNNEGMRRTLEALGNPNDGYERVIFMDVPANLPKEPTWWQRFLNKLGLLEFAPIRGSVNLLESGSIMYGKTHEYLWRFNKDLNLRFELLKKQCEYLLKLSEKL